VGQALSPVIGDWPCLFPRFLHASAGLDKRHYRKPSLSARRPEQPAVFEEMLAAAKPVGITPRTPAVRVGACLPAGLRNHASGWPALGRDAPETVVFNHWRHPDARVK